MKRAANRAAREPTIALINVVFLMLIFFLIAGTVAQPLPKELKLVKTSDLDPSIQQDGLILFPNGDLKSLGQDYLSPEAFLADLSEKDKAIVRLIPDQNVPAQTLLRVAAAIKDAGAKKVVIATERALK